MSHMGDSLLKYEENNFNELAEKFINKHRDEWDEFVIEQFEDSRNWEAPDMDDEYHGEDKGHD